MNTFIDDVAREIFNYTKAHPRKLRESVWSFGFTKSSPRKIFDISKMFLAVPGVSYGFTVSATSEPLVFHVKTFELRTQGDEQKLITLGNSTEQVALLKDAPKVVENAARQAKALADALHLEANSSYGVQ